jgi:hypothetical protein
MKVKSLRRISNFPPEGGVIPALIETVLPFNVVTLRLVKLAEKVGTTAAGNQASAGTVGLVLIARSSAQSLAKWIAYSTMSG